MTPLSFTCEAGALSFLTLHSFDFNKLIYEAAPYANKDRLNRFTLNQTWLHEKKNYEMKRDVVERVNRFREVVASVSFPAEVIFDISRLSVIGVKALEYALETSFPELTLEFSYDSELLGDRKKLTIKATVKKEPLPQIFAQTDLSQSFFNIDNFTDPAGVASFISIMSQRNLPLITHNGFGDLLHVAASLISSTERSSASFLPPKASTRINCTRPSAKYTTPSTWPTPSTNSSLQIIRAPNSNRPLSSP